MVVPPIFFALWGVVSLISGFLAFWRDTRGSLAGLSNIGAFVGAAGDALGLVYMKGESEGGCEYPGERPSRTRWLLHLSLMWGFLSALAATAFAFYYQDILGVMPPYPIISIPVLLGSLGGMTMIVGATGLMLVKMKSDPAPAHKPQVAMDYVFLTVIDFASLTGLALLLLRYTPFMGSLLIVHLAFVCALFVAAPYGKFAHLVYRYAALVQNRIESAE